MVFAEPRKEAAITKHMSNLCRFQHEDKVLTLQAHPKRLHIQIFHEQNEQHRNGMKWGHPEPAWPRCPRYRKDRSCCFEVSQTHQAQAHNSRRGDTGTVGAREMKLGPFCTIVTVGFAQNISLLHQHCF